jgi:DNA-binding transcriptional MerR regulator
MELMTMAELAKQTGLPESTVRYYRERFAPYVPVVGEGRGRHYHPEALASHLPAGAPVKT